LNADNPSSMISSLSLRVKVFNRAFDSRRLETGDGLTYMGAKDCFRGEEGGMDYRAFSSAKGDRTYQQKARTNNADMDTCVTHILYGYRHGLNKGNFAGAYATGTV